MTTTKGDFFYEKFQNARKKVEPEIEEQMKGRSVEDQDRYAELYCRVDDADGALITTYIGLYLMPYENDIEKYLNLAELYIDQTFPGFIVSEKMRSVMRDYSKMFIRVYSSK